MEKLNQIYNSKPVTQNTTKLYKLCENNIKTENLNYKNNTGLYSLELSGIKKSIYDKQIQKIINIFISHINESDMLDVIIEEELNELDKINENISLLENNVIYSVEEGVDLNQGSFCIIS